MQNKTYRSVLAGMATVIVLTTGAMTAMAATNTSVQKSQAGAAAMVTTKSTMVDDDAIDTEMMVGMPSPIAEYDTLAEAEKAVGFRIQVPATITGYEEVSYSVISDELIQVNYRGAHGDICIRKAASSIGEDISGDYNVYKDTQTVTVRGHKAVIHGEGATAALATWTNQGYAYSVGIYDENGLSMTSQGMSVADIQNLVYVVR